MEPSPGFCGRVGELQQDLLVGDRNDWGVGPAGQGVLELQKNPYLMLVWGGVENLVARQVEPEVPLVQFHLRQYCHIQVLSPLAAP